MVEMLNKVVTDPSKAWGKGSFEQSKVIYTISKDSVEEFLKSGLDKETIVEDPEAARKALPKLKVEATKVRDDYIDNGVGFVLIQPIDRLDNEQKADFYVAFGAMIGNPLEQNAAGDILYTVQNIDNKTMEEGARYSKSKSAGSLHTDSPQRSHPPEYLALLCIRQGLAGGNSLFVSAYSVHNKILESRPDLLPVLYEPFHFDLKTDATPENQTNVDPIFTYDSKTNRLTFRFLVDYIRSGHERVGQPLTKQQDEAITLVDSLLYAEELTFQGRLEPGMMTFGENTRIVHGRTPFEDHEELEKRRLMLRLWLHDPRRDN